MGTTRPFQAVKARSNRHVVKMRFVVQDENIARLPKKVAKAPKQGDVVKITTVWLKPKVTCSDALVVHVLDTEGRLSVWGCCL